MTADPLKLFTRILTAPLARDPEPPVRVEARAGGGIHVLLYPVSGPFLHVQLLPAGSAGPVLVRTPITALAYEGEGERAPREARWLATLVAALPHLEARAGWATYLHEAAALPRVGLPAAVRPPDRVTSGQAALIRLTTRCDARCDFCSARGVLPDLFERPEDVEARLKALAAAGCRVVSFTGGEPLLLPDLIRWVARCRELGIPAVDLQTNGLRLGVAGRARALKAAGLSSIFLSLHSADAATHDALLGVRRAFPRALRALDAAVAAGLAVRVNCVVSRPNLGGLEALVRLLAERLPPGQASLCLSFVAPQGWALDHLDLMPSLTEATPALERALAVGAELGVDVRIPGLCGVPGCVLPAHLDRFEELQDPDPPPRIPTRSFGPACAPACALYPRCSGFWTVYLERHGAAELRPVVTPGASDRAPAASPAPVIELAPKSVILDGRAPSRRSR